MKKNENWSEEIREVLKSLHRLEEDSESQRSDTASRLFEEGYRKQDDALMGLSLYYLNHDKDKGSNDHLRRFLHSQIRDDVTGLLTMRPFLSHADALNASRKEN